MKKILSKEQKATFLKEHLEYEIAMLRWTAGVLSGTHEAKDGPFIVNVMIESFCMHARNIHEFMTSSKPESTGSVASSNHFTDTKKQHIVDKLPESLVAKLNNAASHPGYRRVTASEKVSGDDIAKIYSSLNEQIKGFYGSLSDEYKNK